MNDGRRQFIHGLAAGVAMFAVPGAFAQQLSETVRTTEGPFYPDRLPLDTDNDLLIVNDAITPAVGEVTDLTGRVLTPAGSPVRSALVEIWQTDSRGSYVHTQGRQPWGFDQHFQGYGRVETDSRGRYRFRTIKPVEYTLRGMYRAPHIHVAVGRSGRRLLTTQLLVEGDPANARDSVTRRLGARELASILVPFRPVSVTAPRRLAAAFDIVLRDA
jgi:protocatechuate 3,4-dioxygenase, beta subunit